MKGKINYNPEEKFPKEAEILKKHYSGYPTAAWRSQLQIFEAMQEYADFKLKEYKKNAE